MEEILVGRIDDPLVVWIKDTANRQALLLDEVADQDIVNSVVEVGYADDLTDDQLDARRGRAGSISDRLLSFRKRSLRCDERSVCPEQETAESKNSRRLRTVWT